jgi:hypothetical protein
MLVLVGMLASGCKSNLVKYEYFIEKPTAIRKDNTIEVNLGYTRASSNWVKPSVVIDRDVIYVSGELTLKEMPQVLLISLPSPKAIYRLFWVDGDGNKTEIGVEVERLSK